MSRPIVGHVSRRNARKSGHPSRYAPRIRLREYRSNGKKEALLDAATYALGKTTDLSRAELFEVSDRTIRRARLGILGEDFMAKVVSALKPHESDLVNLDLAITTVGLDTFFEVSDGW